MMQHWLVPSASQEFEKYEVTYSDESGYRCDCPGYLFRRQCSHVRTVQAIRDTNVVFVGVW